MDTTILASSEETARKNKACTHIVCSTIIHIAASGLY